MSEPKFTPGPWEAGKNPCMATVLDGHEGKAIYPKDGSNHIAWANAENEDGELNMQTALANARLIAAAPEMYEMLENILNDCGICVHTVPIDGYTTPYQQIKAVLRKARGESEVSDDC